MALVESTDLNQVTRKKLYGKTATAEDWIKEIVRLKVGDPKKKIIPQTNDEIAARLGITRQYVGQYLKLALKHGLAESDPKNPDKIQITKTTLTEFQRFSDRDSFSRNPLVADWIQNHLLIVRDGEPRIGWTSIVNKLKTICNTLKINPEQLIQDHDSTEKYFLAFVSKLQTDEVDAPTRKKKANIKISRKSAVDALRSFCGFHHITWGKGMSKTMACKVVNHGNFADIKLSKYELHEALEYIKSKWGLDSDIFRVFVVGVESCARRKALLTMKCDWTEHQTKKGKIIFFMTAFESKTKHIKNGKWTKYITLEEVQQSLRLQKARGLQFIWTDRQKCADSYTKRYGKKEKIVTLDNKYEELATQLREIYAHVGKIPNLDELYKIKDTEHTNNYFFNHPFHSLRHIGAHYWLDKKDYNATLVATIGGWHTQDELTKSYGEIPPEKVVELMEKED